MKQGSVKIAKKTLKDPEVVNMFGQMVGTTEPDPLIIMPKYDAIMTICRDTISLLRNAFLKEGYIPSGIRTDFQKGFTDIQTFCNESEKELQRLTLKPNEGVLAGKDLAKLNSDVNLLQQYITSLDCKYKITELAPTYKELKSGSTVKTIIVTARDIKEILDIEQKHKKSTKHDLENENNLCDDFIVNYDSDYLRVIKSITVLDFKQMWLHPQAIPAFKNRMLYALHVLFKKSMELYKEISSPDVDAEKFSIVLIESIEKIKQVPELQRCSKAFDKISSSVDLLKGNFGEYYKDFIQSNNPGIIVENFVLDVAKTHNSDLATTQQFKTIVNYYKKILHGKIQDPKINKMFDLVRDNISVLEDKQIKDIKKNDDPDKDFDKDVKKDPIGEPIKKEKEKEKEEKEEKDKKEDKDKKDDKDNKDDKDKKEEKNDWGFLQPTIQRVGKGKKKKKSKK